MNRTEIFKISNDLGLSVNEVNEIFNNDTNEEITLSIGPYPYGGNHYGVLSIKDF